MQFQKFFDVIVCSNLRDSLLYCVSSEADVTYVVSVSVTILRYAVSALRFHYVSLRGYRWIHYWSWTSSFRI